MMAHPLPRVGLGVALAVALAACDHPPPAGFSGYAEGDYIHVAAPLAGVLARQPWQRGDQARAGQPAFALEQANEAAQRREVTARIQQARNQLADLQKGRRPDEIAAVREQLQQAEAARAMADANLARETRLVQQNFIAAARLDELRTAARQSQARVAELQAQLRSAELPARPDQLAAAQSEIRALEAQLAQADWRLDQKSQRLPVDGTVTDVVLRPGEWAPAGGVVLTLLPPQNLKARFFVPQAALGTLRLGQAVHLNCDGCGAPIPASISFIAREAEYTAPLIYSRESRAKLVFMIEARPAPDQATRLHPGQPLEVTLAP